MPAGPGDRAEQEARLAVRVVRVVKGGRAARAEMTATVPEIPVRTATIQTMTTAVKTATVPIRATTATTAPETPTAVRMETETMPATAAVAAATAAVAMAAMAVTAVMAATDVWLITRLQLLPLSGRAGAFSFHSTGTPYEKDQILYSFDGRCTGSGVSGLLAGPDGQRSRCRILRSVCRASCRQRRRQGQW